MGAQCKQTGRSEHAATRGQRFTGAVTPSLLTAETGGANPAAPSRWRMALEPALCLGRP